MCARACVWTEGEEEGTEKECVDVQNTYLEKCDPVICFVLHINFLCDLLHNKVIYVNTLRRMNRTFVLVSERGCR